MPLLQAVQMELEDCSFPLLKEIKIGTDPYAVFEGVDVAFLIGAKPRGPNSERKDLISVNGAIFAEQGKALNRSANRDVKVLVTGNPCNTNALIALHNAPDLSRKNFHALTRLDQNRAQSFLAKKAGVPNKEVTKVAIWGNHSSTQVPDFFHAEISGKKVMEIIKDTDWLYKEFTPLVQKRGAEIIKVRGKSSAASAAFATLSAMKDLFFETSSDTFYSSAIHSSLLSYPVDKDLFFSAPCKTGKSQAVEPVSGLDWNEYLEEKIKISEKELIEERDMALNLLGTK